MRLDTKSRRVRQKLANAEWEMSVCLLAMVRSSGFRKLGYATISEYGEKVLNLSGKKLAWLLGTAHALEHLPLLSEAFREGKVGWGKVRALQSLATPETEHQWLDFALVNSTAEVSKRVAMSPTQWKKHRALAASLRKEPMVTSVAVQEVLSETEGEPVEGDGRGNFRVKAAGDEGRISREDVLVTEASTVVSTAPMRTSGGEHRPALSPLQSRSEGRKSVPEQSSTEHSSESLDTASHCTSLKPGLPEKIRVVVEFTPDQFALYEAAEQRVRAQAGKRIPRAELVTRMAERVLDSSTARARAKHQVLIHTCDNCRSAWYETSQGLHPVGPEILENALGNSEPLRIEPLEQNSGKTGQTEQRKSRRDSATINCKPSNVRPSEQRLEATKDDEPRKVVTTPNPKPVKVNPLNHNSADPENNSRVGAKNLPGKKLRQHSNDEGDFVSKIPEKNDKVDSQTEDVGFLDRTLGEELSRNPLGDDSRVNSTPRPGHLSYGREYIPNATLRTVFARAGNCCERCGSRSALLEVHHVKPVSEGGGNKVEDLRLYCRACHSLHHQRDIEEKPTWQRARQAAISAALISRKGISIPQESDP